MVYQESQDFDYRADQRRLDTCHRTRDYFAFQWPLIVLMKKE